MARAGLGHDEAPARAAVEAHQHRAEVLRADRDGLRRLLRGRGERLARAERAAPLAVQGGQVGQDLHRGGAQQVLGEVRPVRPDVRHRARATAGLLVEPPAPVRVEQQPVLQVRAVHEVRRAGLLLGERPAQVLDDGVVAVVEADRRDEPALAARVLGQRDELRRLGGGHAERLLAQHVLARGERVAGLRGVQRVDRAHVDRVDGRVREQLARARARARDAGRVRERPRLRGIAAGDRRELHAGQAPQRLGVPAGGPPRAQDADAHDVSPGRRARRRG